LLQPLELHITDVVTNLLQLMISQVCTCTQDLGNTVSKLELS